MAAERAEVLRLSGHRVRVTRPGKELFPQDGITKADLVAHYRAVAPRMLPHLRGRPLSLERRPDGLAGEAFFTKRVPGHFPGWIARAEVAKKDGTLTMVVCKDTATLAYLAAQAAITLHPWLSRLDRPERPDRLIFDLDPPGDDFGLVRWAAFAMRDLLVELGLRPAVMTTGSRGLHLLVPLRREEDHDGVRAFARAAAGALARRHPDRLTTEPRKDRRRGRLYLDTQRNAYAQTGVAPYAVRARPHAPVATPLHWEELADERVGPRHWTLRSLPGRLADCPDPWAGLGRDRRSLGPARRRLAELEPE
ncbi:non-homologous end-joining DNA ligase [Streptomyces hoynatensis]|uniref:ATP-dependent DNA ligase n=1 Tax=Streptomyces hoynatensis TaxID=1141874 RepID=A0A3A9YVK0_9ACTN|nr:non-homologous end-joining DNA ligase [Streptomyces hoynatensis]RKN40078.1 ATP-dependent DNA ligase [Streptomyces hoynatensis]